MKWIKFYDPLIDILVLLVFCIKDFLHSYGGDEGPGILRLEPKITFQMSG